MQVPAQVSYELFWLRYLYKVQLLQQVCFTVTWILYAGQIDYLRGCVFLQEEERRAELMARAKPREQHWQWDEDTDEGRPPLLTNILHSTNPMILKLRQL